MYQLKCESATIKHHYSRALREHNYATASSSTPSPQNNHHFHHYHRRHHLIIRGSTCMRLQNAYKCSAASATAHDETTVEFGRGQHVLVSGLCLSIHCHRREPYSMLRLSRTFCSSLVARSRVCWQKCQNNSH